MVPEAINLKENNSLFPFLTNQRFSFRRSMPIQIEPCIGSVRIKGLVRGSPVVATAAFIPLDTFNQPYLLFLNQMPTFAAFKQGNRGVKILRGSFCKKEGKLPLSIVP